MQTLNLSHNNITLDEIPYQWRHNWLKLKYLDVSFNRLGPNINVLQLKFEQKDIAVDLSYNEVERITFEPMISNTFYQTTPSSNYKRIINITNNPIICDCESLNLAKMFHKKLENSVQDWFQFSETALLCTEPKKLEGMSIMKVPFDKFSCAVSSCPKSCSCDIIPFTSEIEVKCNGKVLENFPSLSSLSYLNVSHVSLNVADNKIKNLGKTYLETNVPYIASLVLSNNSLTTLSLQDVPSSITNELFLDGNKFERINQSVLEFMTKLKYVKLGNNNFACDCGSYQLYRFVMHNRLIIKDINNITFNCHQATGEHIKAVTINDQDESKNKAVFCTNYNRLMSTVVLPIVLLLLIIGVILLILMCNKELILIKLYGHPLTRKCFKSDKEDSSLPYDVFISYAHQDEQYVEEVLVPGLEETKDIKYKCLVHVRDFVPGRNISEQIIEAVDNSKRTLICLSKHFVESDWAQH